MEGQELNPLYQILESSSKFWPPLNSNIDGLLSPQNCNVSPYQNLDRVTNPPSPPLIQRVTSENLISDSSVEQLQVSNMKGKQKRKKKENQNEKETWYKGPWTKSEDRKLRCLVKQYGYRKWAAVAKHMPRRIGKQCRERWHNNLRPNISKSIVWSDEEEMMIIEGHKRFGNRWSQIAKFVPGRSENDIKNHWNKTRRRQCSTKNIQRPKRLRGLYQSTVLENYIRKTIFNAASTSTAAAAVAPPPVATVHRNNALTAIASSAAAVTSALIETSAAYNQPQITAIGEKDDLVVADRPLSVDDYDIDGVPYFTFESGVIDENYVDDNGDAIMSQVSPLIGGADYAAAAVASYLAVDETVDEEMNFLRSLFGGINGGMLW